MRRRISRKVDPEKFRTKVAAQLVSFDEFAARSGVSRRTIGNAAAGGRVNLPTAAAIAKALDCDPDEFSQVVRIEFAEQAAS